MVHDVSDAQGIPDKDSKEEYPHREPKTLGDLPNTTMIVHTAVPDVKLTQGTSDEGMLNSWDQDEYIVLDTSDEDFMMEQHEVLRDTPSEVVPASVMDEDTNSEEDPSVVERMNRLAAAKAARQFGHIPGVKIGANWKYRRDCSLAGVHRPHTAGIHGTEKDGAFSIVVSGGQYPDYDKGDTIIYSGAGGHQRLDDDFHVGPRICDQSWYDWGNQSLVTSQETRNPVCVVRGYQLDSDYAPLKGYRYDGLYTVQHVWQEKNSEGLLNCRYRLERIPGQPPIPRRSGRCQDTRRRNRKQSRKNLSPVSVAAPGTAVATTQSSPTDSSIYDVSSL